MKNKPRLIKNEIDLMSTLTDICNKADPIHMPKGMVENTNDLLSLLLEDGVVRASKFGDLFSWRDHFWSERMAVIDKPETVPFSRGLLRMHSEAFAYLVSGLDVGTDFCIYSMLQGLGLEKELWHWTKKNRRRLTSGSKAESTYDLRFKVWLETSPAGRDAFH